MAIELSNYVPLMKSYNDLKEVSVELKSAKDAWDTQIVDLKIKKSALYQAINDSTPSHSDAVILSINQVKNIRENFEILNREVSFGKPKETNDVIKEPDTFRVLQRVYALKDRAKEINPKNFDGRESL